MLSSNSVTLSKSMPMIGSRPRSVGYRRFAKVSAKGRRTHTTQVLIVEDFADFRTLLVSTLKQRSDLAVIGQAKDGLEAIEQIRRSRPDLILLDIGLPKMNGIEIIRRIGSLLDKTKVLIVSQDGAEDVVQEALRLGAHGYVAKSDIGTQLFPAIDAVLSGKCFVGRTLAGLNEQ